MKIKAVLFDLDGTLLPMDQDNFFRCYFKLLATKLYPYGYTDPKTLVKVVWGGVEAVEKNDGSKFNGQVFWDFFSSKYGPGSLDHLDVLDDFYAKEFQSLKDVCGYSPEADGAVKAIKEMGLRAVIATKPIFPKRAVESRIGWAGLEVNDFEFYTDYDSCKYCKPRVDYYKEIADKLGVLPEECLMVGNDVAEDMTAGDIGMKTFLLTDSLINTNNVDISAYRNGSYKELLEYVKELA